MKTKLLFTILLIFLFGQLSVAQNIKLLAAVPKNIDDTKNYAIIYGNFIQRLGFSSGGFQQDIRIQNVETNEIYSFRVKPTMKSAKENIFCSYIKPGTYKIINYYWTQSKWYGGKVFTEPIFKGFEASKLAQLQKEGKPLPNNLEYYTFIIPEKGVYYLGAWNFDKELVSFTDNKEAFDLTMKTEYPGLNWNQATTNIPK